MKVSNLNIFHISAGRYPTDNLEHSTSSIWKELSKGFNSYYVFGRSKNFKIGYLKHNNLRINLLPSLISSESEFFFTQFFILFYTLKLKPDIIVVQCPVLGGLVATIISKFTNAKILMEFHTIHYFENKKFFSKNKILEIFTRYNLQKSNMIRVLSDGMKTALLHKYGNNYNNIIEILPPRVNLNIFNKKKINYNLINNELKVVIVGIVNDNKGQYRFLKYISSKLPYLLTYIIGDGEDYEKCKQLTYDLNINNRTFFLGHLNQNELSDILPNFDILISFSKKEGTPRVIIEGMASGLPIIATNAGYTAELFDDGIEGFLLGNSKINEMLYSIDLLFNDKNLRQKMGNNGIIRAEKFYDSKILYEKYRDLISRTYRK